MSEDILSESADEEAIQSAIATCKAALSRLGMSELSEANVDSEEARRAVLKPYFTEAGGWRYDEAAYFLEMWSCLRIHARIREMRARITELRATTAEASEDFETLSKGDKRRRRKAHGRAIEQLEANLLALTQERSMLQMSVPHSLRAWSMLCFSRCCKDADCCHIRQAIEILPLVREAEGKVKGDPTNEGFVQTLQAHRDRLTECLGDGMRATTHFANLMHESAGELWRYFVDVIISAFGVVVDMLEAERLNPTQKPLS